MIKAKIKSISLKQWSSGDAIEIVVVTEEDDTKYPRAGIGTTAPDWLFEQWVDAIGVNPLQLETVEELRSLIGKEVLVEYEEDARFGMKIKKVAPYLTLEDKIECLETQASVARVVHGLDNKTPINRTEEITQEIQDDDIPF